MEIKVLLPGDLLWETVADFAENCIWPAGKALAERMRGEKFRGWECVIAAFDENKVAGFCVLSETDCLPDAPYCPWIGFVFVDIPYRGNRLSASLIDAAAAQARTAGFDRIFLVSDHLGLYEKYGFTAIDRRPAPWNQLKTETIFMREMDAAPAPQPKSRINNMLQLMFYILILIALWVAVGKIFFPA